MQMSESQVKLFTRLWVNAQPVVASYILSATRHNADAEDLLHAVAEAAVTDFDRYDASRSFTGWILGIARNRILKHYRDQGRERHVFGGEALDILAQTHERAAQDQTEYHKALRRCMQNLTQEHRRLLELRYHEDMRTNEIAKQSGMTQRAVINALHRIRQRLAGCIRQRIDSEGEVGSA